MRKVYSAESVIAVAHLRNVLESAGIVCEIRNDRLLGAVGEIPFLECWPELWVLDERDVLRAQALIDAELARPEQVSGSWRCRICGEEIEGQFADCWRCAAGSEDEGG